MNVKSFRAKSLPEALWQVHQELGPDAAVLQTREISEGIWGRLTGRKQVEVTASVDVQVESSLPSAMPCLDPHLMWSVRDNMTSADQAGLALESMSPSVRPYDAIPSLETTSVPNNPANAADSPLDAMIGDLRGSVNALEVPQALFKAYTDLVDAEFDEEIARSVIGDLRKRATLGELEDSQRIEGRLRELVKSWIRPHGPITISPGRPRVVALVGPTGVGKTTTIAKLAANYRLREKIRVGLVTVDTYRIAAVDQLRTYADIIDLPMEVVATSREMREAINRLSDLDLILMDTAGRSPRDEVRIQELKVLLQEAEPDEVHLVLSTTCSARALKRTAEEFAPSGINALLVTKLDEATGLGNLVPLLRSNPLPISYVTNGQNVPDDIQVADPNQLTEWILTGRTS